MAAVKRVTQGLWDGFGACSQFVCMHLHSLGEPIRSMGLRARVFRSMGLRICVFSALGFDSRAPRLRLQKPTDVGQRKCEFRRVASIRRFVSEARAPRHFYDKFAAIVRGVSILLAIARTDHGKQDAYPTQVQLFNAS